MDLTFLLKRRYAHELDDLRATVVCAPGESTDTARLTIDLEHESHVRTNSGRVLTAFVEGFDAGLNQERQA